MNKHIITDAFEEWYIHNHDKLNLIEEKISSKDAFEYAFFSGASVSKKESDIIHYLDEIEEKNEAIYIVFKKLTE